MSTPSPAEKSDAGRTALVTAPRVLALAALVLLVVAGVSWLRGVDSTLQASGTVGATDPTDPGVAAAGAAGCTGDPDGDGGVGGEPATVMIATIDWELSGNPKSGTDLHVRLDGPTGWVLFGCLPAGSESTSTGERSDTVATVRAPTDDGTSGTVTVTFRPEDDGSIPDLEPWSADVVLVDDGGQVGESIQIELGPRQGGSGITP